jgi:hypothetical protein
LGFGVAGAGGELEAVVCAPFREAAGDDFGVGLEDDAQVGPGRFGVERPQEGRVQTVEALHDQARRDVAVGDDGLTQLQLRPDLVLHMVVAVSGVQAGQGMPRDGFGQLAGQDADGPGGAVARLKSWIGVSPGRK